MARLEWRHRLISPKPKINTLVLNELSNLWKIAIEEGLALVLQALNNVFG